MSLQLCLELRHHTGKQKSFCTCGSERVDSLWPTPNSKTQGPPSVLARIWFPVLSHLLPHNSQCPSLPSVQNSSFLSSLSCTPARCFWGSSPEPWSSWFCLHQHLSGPWDSANLTLWIRPWPNNPESVTFALTLQHALTLLSFWASSSGLTQGLASWQATLGHGLHQPGVPQEPHLGPYLCLNLVPKAEFHNPDEISQGKMQMDHHLPSLTLNSY